MDDPTIEMLPRLHVVLDRDAAERGGAGHVLDAARAAADAGARFFQLREKNISSNAYWRLAEDVAEVLAAYDGVALVVNDRVDISMAVDARGVHRPQNGLPVHTIRQLIEYRLIGVSCHDRAEIDDAVHEGADYVTLSPVFSTSSKPDVTPLGIATVREIAASTFRPVFVLGGVTPGRVGPCIDAGAHGVAVLSGIMEAKNPYAATRAYLDAVQHAVGLE